MPRLADRQWSLELWSIHDLRSPTLVVEQVPLNALHADPANSLRIRADELESLTRSLSHDNRGPAWPKSYRPDSISEWQSRLTP